MIFSDIAGHNPEELWSELLSVEGSLTGQENLLKKIRNCSIPNDQGDKSRRISTKDALEKGLVEEEPTDAAEFYDSPDLQRLHEYILSNRLSENQANELIHLLTDVIVILKSIS